MTAAYDFKLVHTGTTWMAAWENSVADRALSVAAVRLHAGATAAESRTGADSGTDADAELDAGAAADAAADAVTRSDWRGSLPLTRLTQRVAAGMSLSWPTNITIVAPG